VASGSEALSDALASNEPFEFYCLKYLFFRLRVIMRVYWNSIRDFFVNKLRKEVEFHLMSEGCSWACGGQFYSMGEQLHN